MNRVFFLSFLGFSTLVSAAVAVDLESPARMRSTVEALTQLPSGMRNFKNLKALDEASDRITSEWKAMGFEVTEQKFEAVKRSYKNLIVRYGPEDAPVFVIGAHYDVCAENIREHFSGADDNASGVAGLLELSRYLAKAKPILKTRLELVAYTLEEPPFFGTKKMGSYVHAKSLNDQKADVRGMISLEMLGYFSDDEGSQTFPFAPLRYVYGTIGNFIAVVGGLSDYRFAEQIQMAMQSHSEIPVRMLSAPRNYFNTDWSDQRNYWEFGYNAVMLTDTALFRNLNYHTPADTPEKLNYEKMAQVVQGLEGFIETSLGERE